MRGAQYHAHHWEWEKAKEAASNGMRFASRFLALRIAQGQSLAVAIAGAQRETALLPELTKLAGESEGMHVEMARMALANIKTKEAVLALLRTSVDPKQNSFQHEQMAKFAVDHGDCEAAAELQRLAANSDYPEQSRKAFAQASEAITAKLKKNP